MGLGDEIMASGHAQRVWNDVQRPIVIADAHGKPRWSEVWENNPVIVRKPTPDSLTIKNAPGCRPYIAYPWNGRQKFSGWRARDHIGRFYFTDAEIDAAIKATAAISRPFLVIGPTIKANANPNKDWGFDRYQALVEVMPAVTFVQLGPSGTRRLRGIRHIETPGFRSAAAILALAAGYVGAEGAMHHAAAALSLPAVVLVGSAVPVESLCYETHTNMAHGDPCGSWAPCAHCRTNMDEVTVNDVAGAVQAVWSGHGPISA